MHGHRKSPFSHPSPLKRGAQNSFEKFHGLKIASNYFLAKIGINFRKTDNFVYFYFYLDLIFNLLHDAELKLDLNNILILYTLFILHFFVIHALCFMSNVHEQ